MTRAELIATLRVVAALRGETLLREAADALEAERRDAVRYLEGEAARVGGVEGHYAPRAIAARQWARAVECGDHEGASS